jgi:hypothetical protein
MTTSTTFVPAYDLVDYWADALVEPNYNQLNLFDVEPQVINKNIKHHACIDPLMLMIFIATCFEHDLIDDTFLENLDEKTLMDSIRQKDHPIYVKLQSLFVMSLHIATSSYRSFIEHMHESNVNFQDSFYNEAFKLAVSMKYAYKLNEFSMEQVKNTCSVVNTIRNEDSLQYNEAHYTELVKELDYLFLTSGTGYIVNVSKEIEDNIHYISKIKPGVHHFNTYVTATIMPFVIGYIDKYGKMPTSVLDFSTFLQERLIENAK